VDENGVVLTNQSDLTLRVVKERKTPGLWLDLKKSFFEQKLFGSAAAGKLYSNSLFKEYFRGLLFEVEEVNSGEGSMATLDFSRAEIKVIFKSENTITNSDGTTGTSITRKTIDLGIGFNGSSRRANTINLIDYDYSTRYTDGLADLSGENIYIKGGEGSVLFIDIPIADIEALRDENLLVNEANLVFYINQSDDLGMGSLNQIEPQRVYLFDATNNRPILDYSADGSVEADMKRNKRAFGGIITKESVAPYNGIKYKVRLTSHINRVINGEAGENDNIRLGLVVTENINIFSNAYLSNPLTFGFDKVPFGHVMSPLGTVLHGPNSTEIYTDPDTGDDIPLKLKLEIYYTKPN
jgi:hypothetical protein